MFVRCTKPSNLSHSTASNQQCVSKLLPIFAYLPKNEKKKKQSERESSGPLHEKCLCSMYCILDAGIHNLPTSVEYDLLWRIAHVIQGDVSEWMNKNCTKVETYFWRKRKKNGVFLLVLVIWIACCCSVFSHWNVNAMFFFHLFRACRHYWTEKFSYYLFSE